LENISRLLDIVTTRGFRSSGKNQDQHKKHLGQRHYTGSHAGSLGIFSLKIDPASSRRMDFIL
jgi:hypothetical protein